MHPSIEKMRSLFQLDVESPFELRIDGNDCVFQCLIKGYGAKLGMVVDSDWSKLAPVADKLTELGYGYSCMDILDPDMNGMEDVLNDWGISNA